MIHDYRGDFEIAAQEELGNSVDVDWLDIRVTPRRMYGRTAAIQRPEYSGPILLQIYHLQKGVE